MGQRIEKAGSPTKSPTHRGIESADAARDRGDWLSAARQYDELVERDSKRDDLRIQSGNCFKEGADYAAALRAYRAVEGAAPRVEAALQIGHLLKITGNLTAASVFYAWSAAKGNADAAHELEHRQPWDIRQPSGSQARDRPHAADDWLRTCVLAVARNPLDCVAMASAAVALAAGHMDAEATVLFNLVTIVAGPARERRPWLKAILAESGLWPAYPSFIDDDPASVPSARRALLSLTGEGAEGIDPADRNPSRLQAADAAIDWPGSVVVPLAPDLSEPDDLLKRQTALLVEVRDAIFAWTSEGDAGRLGRAIAAMAASHRSLRYLYVVFPYGETPSASRDLARGVLLDVCARVIAHLAMASRAHGHDLGHLLSIPTRVANAALCDPADVLWAGAAESDDPAIDPHARRRLHEAFVLTGALAPITDVEEIAALTRLHREGRWPAVMTWAHRRLTRDPPATEIVLKASEALKVLGAWSDARILAEACLRANPTDPACQWSAGILAKTMGDYDAAARSFIGLLDQDRDNANAAHELGAVVREVFGPAAIAGLADTYPAFGHVARARHFIGRVPDDDGATDPAMQASIRGPNLVGTADATDFGPERTDVLQIGWLRKRRSAGDVPRLLGIIAVRLRIISRAEVVALRVRIDGRTVDRVPPTSSGQDGGLKHCFYANSWINVAAMPRGPAELQIYVEFADASYHERAFPVFIDDIAPSEDFATCDAIVMPPGETGAADAKAIVAALPTMARPAARSAFPKAVKRVLLMRMDQLGDVATSLFAMQRIRACFPDSTFEALVSPANEMLVRTIGIFETVTTVPFVYDHASRRRSLTPADERALRQRYADRGVDIAIDLSPADDSRPMLTLLGARFMIGFKPQQFEFLDFGIEVRTRDPVNRRENVSHPSMIAMLAEAIAVAAAPPHPRLPYPGDRHDILASLNLRSQGYVAVHAGARLAIKRWPLENFVTVACMIRSTLHVPVVLFADAALPDAALARLADDPGIILQQGPMDFAAFDALVSHARLFVANDSGPKHLASVRGVHTVSIHMDQVNWNEWGHDGEGYILSRRVPCCGCGIEDPSECGKALACLTQITPDAVFSQVQAALANG